MLVSYALDNDINVLIMSNLHRFVRRLLAQPVSATKISWYALLPTFISLLHDLVDDAVCRMLLPIKHM